MLASIGGLASIAHAGRSRGVLSISRGLESWVVSSSSASSIRGALRTGILRNTMGGALRFMSTAPEQAEIKPSPKSVVSHPYALDERPLDAKKPSNPEDRFAVVSLSGTQFKVTVGDTIVADHMEGLDIGDRVVYPEVLLVGSRRATVVGRPLVEKAEVHCSVEELTRDKKVITFKSRRRKNSRRLRGFRRRVTILRVDSIKVSTADHELL